jgi:hypothetical protein
LTAGDRPTHGFEHHEFVESAGVSPRRLRKVESLTMIIRLMRSFGGVTVQPALSIDRAQLEGLTVVPFRDVLENRAPSQQENDELAIINAIRQLTTKPS